jgi:hypothetical protein
MKRQNPNQKKERSKMPRFVPPMYGKVQRKVPPRPTRPITGPATPAAPEKAAEPEAPKKKASKKAAKKKAVAKKAPAKKKAAKKAAPKKKAAKKKTTKKKATKKKAAAKKPKAIKWDESMTQKELYKKAKAAGLNVRAKDWKSEIVAEIKKYNKKAAK